MFALLEFVNGLIEAGVECEYVMYAGTLHGFMDRSGLFESSGHCLHYAANNVNKTFRRI